MKFCIKAGFVVYSHCKVILHYFVSKFTPSKLRLLYDCVNNVLIVVPSCAAPECKNRSTEFHYHRFPRDESLKKQWLAKMRRLDPTKSQTMAIQQLWSPTPASRLCSVSLQHVYHLYIV